MRIVRLFGARPPRPASVPVVLPRLDGAGWPDEAVLGRPSFDSNTFYELGLRHAYDPEAHAVADRLVEVVLPHVRTGVSAQDQPYLHKVFSTAARIGAGLGIVERDLSTGSASSVDRHVAGALWQARRRLPAMQPDWRVLAGYFLLAGFHVARTGPELVERLADEASTGDGSAG